MDKDIIKSFTKNEFRKDMYNAIVNNACIKPYYDIMGYVIRTKAWNDALTGIRRSDKYKSFSEKRDEICFELIRAIKELDLSEDSYREWHNKTLCFLEDNYNMSVGIGQKFVNMSIKYISFLELGYDIKLFDNLDFFNIDFDLDIPVDFNILAWTKCVSADNNDIVSLMPNVSNWSAISKYDDYSQLQIITKAKMRELYDNMHYTILECETMLWNNLKRLQVV